MLTSMVFPEDKLENLRKMIVNNAIGIEPDHIRFEAELLDVSEIDIIIIDGDDDLGRKYLEMPVVEYIIFHLLPDHLAWDEIGDVLERVKGGKDLIDEASFILL